ncbi:MAG TPA: MATE family efflux transporter [Burkholderiales bacterium]|nr:MATE family efflux transporter [Burkholderiales bacterium]
MTRSSFLHGPVAPQLLGLAAPVLVVLLVQTLVGIAETYFVSALGTSAIAGVALVFPLFMLMTMMSNGGIGGGVSSAVARALGAGRRRDADSLAFHAVVIALAFGALFSLSAWLGGRALYASLGGEGDTLANALLYSNVVFAAAIPAWITNLLASVLRGAGNVRVPAVVTVAGAGATLILSPSLIFGWGPFPALGVAGAGVAMIVFNLSAAAALALYMRSARTPVRLAPARIEWRLLKDVLEVGLLSAVGTLMVNLTVVLTTGLAGRFGADAIAGYGLASRLDYALIPLLFALGTACVTMVGMNVGAGQHARARRIAWTSALYSVLVTAAIGGAAALAPAAWIHLFSHEPAVVRDGTAYLVRVAPLYPFIGLGLALYFASQGAGNVVVPFFAGVVRLATVLIGGGFWVIHMHGSLPGLFWIVGAGQVLFGSINAAAMMLLRPGASARPAAA